MKTASKLELHYYFDDNSHSMDAYIHNKCATEILALIREVSIALEIEIHLDSEALKEGGLRDVWKFLGKNSPQITLILAVIALILQIKQLYPIEDEMDVELKKLSIEEKKLSIQKLKNEVETGEIKPTTLKEVTNSINLDFKILSRKSNFYKQLDNYEKITGLGINTLTLDDEPTGEEKIIPKEDFFRYILSTDELPDEIIENAEIGIISPVIEEGRYKWKGIYLSEPISFAMNDSDFKNEVLTKQVSFQHGAIIQCVLKIGKELDETGEIIIKGYSVTTVLSKIDGNVVNETPQGKRYKYAKKFKEGQNELFKNEE